MADIKVSEWINMFENEEFTSHDVRTQIKAGWYDWFCADTSLRNKTYRMGRIIKQLKVGGKIDFENWYVWFKNNCRLLGGLYDDFRFADLETGDIRFTIQIDAPDKDFAKYKVYGRKPLENGEWEDHFEEPLFTCNNSKELVKWLNKKWEE